MEVCPNCSHRNRPGLLFCENCGTSLIGDSPLSTKSLGGKNASGDINVSSIMDALGSDVFKQGAMLRIEVEGAEPLLLKPKEETVFGRRDPSSGSMPDVDLTPFAGYRMGVSRKHAIIKQAADPDRLELWDLGSSNGTFLNGTRLTANKPYKIRDGDEIRFGQMAIKVYFQQPAPSEHNNGANPGTIPPAPPTLPTPPTPTPPPTTTPPTVVPPPPEVKPT